MALKERAAYYYDAQDKGCPGAILMAANEVYGLGLTEAEVDLFAGFRAGMGCGSTCGALAGSIGVLSKKYGQRADLKDLCGQFTQAFTQKLACGTADCATLGARYKTEATRCRATVELAAEALEEFIGKLA